MLVIVIKMIKMVMKIMMGKRVMDDDNDDDDDDDGDGDGAGGDSDDADIF